MRKTVLQNNRIANAVRILCAAAAAAMIFVSVTVYGASAAGLLVMLLFAVFYIQLPGLLLVKAAGLGGGHVSTSLALGFFAGWSFELIVYFLADIMRSDIILYCAGPILAIAYLFAAFKDYKGRNASRCIDGAGLANGHGSAREAGTGGISREGFLPSRVRLSRLPLTLCVFMTLVMLYCLLDTQYQYLAPALSDFTYMNPDKAYHLGLVNSLAHDYPLESPWISGRYITYHIFGEMLFSIPVRLFGLEADFVVLSWGPLMTAYCVGVSLYSFFREMCGRPDRAGLYCLITLLSNLYITRNYRSSLAFKFILINDNSAGYGIAAALMTIVCLRRWYGAFTERDPGRLSKGALCLLLIMLTTGIKGPMGAVTTGALWGTFLLGIILKKMPARSLLPLLVYTGGFGLIYFVILGSKGQTNGGGNSIISFASITNIAFWKKPLIALLKDIGLPTSIRLVIVMIVFLIFFLTVFFLPFCIGYVRELILVLRGRRDYDPARVLVYAECAVGFIAMFILNYSGHSQVYFGLVTAFLAPAVSLWFIEDLEAEVSGGQSSKRSGGLLRICTGCMGIMLILTSCSLGAYYIRHIGSAAHASDPHNEYSLYLSISNDEYEAMEWIEHNTGKDALLATDRYYSVAPEEYTYQNRWDNRFFLYPVYSNRFSYIAGSGYNMRANEWPVRKDMIETNMKLYDADNEERGDLARELDIDYVVVSKRFTDAGDLSSRDYSLCFSNDEVDIYKIAE